MPKRDNALLIEDICEAIDAIQRYTIDLDYDTFCSDRKTVDAVLRNLEVIGEAVSRISPDLRTNNPLVEWRLMSDFRNRLIHDYFGINLEMVWDVLQNQLPYNYEFLKRISFE